MQVAALTPGNLCKGFFRVLVLNTPYELFECQCMALGTTHFIYSNGQHLSYYSSPVAALTPTMSRRGFRASVLPPLALVQSGLLAPMVFLTIGVDAENTHRIPKPVRLFLLKHLFLCSLSDSLWVLLFWLKLGSSLFVLSFPPPFCWVLCFMEFARVSSFFVAFMSLCHLDQAKPKTVQISILFSSCW